MQRLFLPVQRFHLALQPLHPSDQGVERGDRLGCVLAGQGGVGGGLESGGDVLGLALDVLLHRLEVLPCQFVRQAEERLVLIFMASSVSLVSFSPFKMVQGVVGGGAKLPRTGGFPR